MSKTRVGIASRATGSVASSGTSRLVSAIFFVTSVSPAFALITDVLTSRSISRFFPADRREVEWISENHSRTGHAAQTPVKHREAQKERRLAQIEKSD
jgi:hypothetical protein